jgi:hypothetical protein
MKFLKSLLMGTGGVVLAGLLLALLAPKAVHAVVATAVQVVNTSASPAITEDTSRQASQIVTIQCFLASSSYRSCTQALPNGTFGGSPGPNGGYVVPANQYFVLKSMDTNLSGTIGIIGIYLFENMDTPSSTERVLPPANGQVSFSSGIVVGPGVEVALEPQASSTGYVTLHGYLTSN